MKLKYYIAILTQFIIVSNCLAQIEVKGFVYDSIAKEPLAGANIYELHTTNQTFANFYGKFKLVVSDTARVQVSYIGYKGVTFKAREYKGDTIFLTEDKNDELVCPVYIDIYYNFIGYYGDLNKYPYGISFYHLRRNLFNRLVNLSGQLNYKTDFQSNYDFQFILKKEELINKNKFKLSASASFQKRKFEDLNINDYEIIFSNYINYRFSLLIGYVIKEDFSYNYNRHDGVLVGLSKFFNNKMTYVGSDISIYKDFFEYDITVLQHVSQHKKFWGNLEFGLTYQYYKDYDELNILARYRF